MCSFESLFLALTTITVNVRGAMTNDEIPNNRKQIIGRSLASVIGYLGISSLLHRLAAPTGGEYNEPFICQRSMLAEAVVFRIV